MTRALRKNGGEPLTGRWNRVLIKATLAYTNKLPTFVAVLAVLSPKADKDEFTILNIFIRQRF
jgi:hypothetical protein